MIESRTNNILSTQQFEEILVYFSNAIHLKKDENEILWDLAKNCISKLGFVDCVVYLVDYDQNILHQKAAYGPKNPKAEEIYNPAIIKLGEGITGHVALTGIAEIISDTSKDSRYILDDQRRLSEVTVPIVMHGNVIGIIDCEHPEKNFFTQQHLRMLSAIAAMCAIKIDSLRVANEKRVEQEKLLAVREEMLALKLQAIRSQMNPHFTFNALNAIQYFITSEEKKNALVYLSIFSKLIRFYLQNLAQDEVNLQDEINMLHWYLKLQKMRYSDRFEYTINVSDTTKRTEAMIPSFLILTLLENIIESAVYNQFKNEKIAITFTISEIEIHLKIIHTHEASEFSEPYLPEYRDRVIKWQDQISLLNKSNSYVIKKDITFIKQKDVHEGVINLILPNLA